jgi:sulfur carrier protein
MGIRLTVNGEPREVPDGATVDAVVATVTGQLRGQGGGVAAAVNGEVVPRRSWAGAPLRDGDQVEVVTAVQGG